MPKRLGLAIFLITAVISPSLYANPNIQQLFQTIFSDWTQAFNQKDLKHSCQLFSPSVIAQYRGTPTKNYTSICEGFKKIFQDKTLSYQYQFKIHNIYRSEDLAAIRITWYLKIFKQGKLVSKTQDEGLDVFEKNNNGQWQIVNYLGYEEKANELKDA